jgi:hypothetical protein
LRRNDTGISVGTNGLRRIRQKADADMGDPGPTMREERQQKTFC